MPTSTALLTMSLLLGTILGGCGVGGCSGGRPSAVSADEGQAISLRELPFQTLEIPDNSRPSGSEPPTAIEVNGPFRYIGTSRKGMHKWATRVPFRPRGLFFHNPRPQMVLRDAEGRTVRYDRFGKHDVPTWSFDRDSLIVYQPTRNPPPEDGQFTLTYPTAVQRERALNLQWSDHAADPSSFVWQTNQDDWDSREGLLLPAPGVAEWAIEVPKAGELHFVSGLVEPEILDGAGSNGARLLVEVETGGTTEEAASIELAVRDFQPQRVDLSRWAGQAVTLRLRTDPMGSADFDYAFVAEPAVTSRLADPVRVVMVFIDTLRPDHMSLYGYERDTTAAIDHLATDAAVFTEARSVAPWTLPSARSLITGRQPEYYDASPTLPALLGQQGWATAFMAGNVYLSVNFDMHRDWDLHRVGLWPMAEKVTDDTLQWLEEHEGRNALVQVHYMDPHLPYIEPRSYRRRYAGDGPEGLREEFHLPEVRKLNLRNKPEDQQYLRDRYDNNIRYATDQVARILDVMNDNDILVLFADHGEEFWDHGGFEHGHTLFDEVMRVPFVVKAPGLATGTFDTPVSLLDLTPTILDLVGQPPLEGLHGRSLVPLLKGDEAEKEALSERSLGFGRPLYGLEMWGVYHGNKKWWTHEGRETLYDLTSDPQERENLLKEDADDSAAPYRDHLADAMGREVAAGYRLVTGRPKMSGAPMGTWALCTVPGGFEHGWLGEDPLDKAQSTLTKHDDPAAVRALLEQYQMVGHDVPDDMGTALEMCWHPGQRGSRELYMVPTMELPDVGMQMVCSAYQGDAGGGKRATFTIHPTRTSGLGKWRTPLRKVDFPQRQVLLQFGIGPINGGDLQALLATDPEMSEMLEALGYVDRDDPEGNAPTAPTPMLAGDRPCPAPTVELPTPKTPPPGNGTIGG
ncbi:MAG: sulfatase [Myxococcales bacterium]|nr:sulfatase [Myxococcales bacterium]